VPEQPEPRRSGRHRWPAAVVRWSARLYLAAAVLLWAALYFAADRWWPATAAMFAPRWMWAVPMALALPAATLLHRKSLLPLALTACVLIWPIGRLCIPWPVASGASGQPALRLRLLTCNTDNVDLNRTAFPAFLAAERPDVVVLQACRNRSRKVFSDGWHVHQIGDICIASRHPISGFRPFDHGAHPEFIYGAGWLAVYELQTPAGPIHVANVHLNSPRKGLEQVIEQRWRGGAALSRNSERRRRQSAIARSTINTVPGPLVIAGDFNTPTDSTIYREHWSDLDNCFSRAGIGFGHTHFTAWTSIRIDHILTGPGWTTRACRVGPDVGSAHRPVVADLELVK
jgi:endonuclease/exonuclease/phosphatase (EEP) superfamily protein YafD